MGGFEVSQFSWEDSRIVLPKSRKQLWNPSARTLWGSNIESVGKSKSRCIFFFLCSLALSFSVLICVEELHWRHRKTAQYYGRTTASTLVSTPHNRFLTPSLTPLDWSIRKNNEISIAIMVTWLTWDSCTRVPKV